MMRPQLLLPMVIFYQQWIFVWFYWQEHKSRPHQCPSILNHRSIFLKGCFTLKQQLLKQLRVKLFVEKNKMRSCILICHSFVSTFCCLFFVIFIVLFVVHRKVTIFAPNIWHFMTFYDIANDTNFVYFQIFIWIFTPKLSLKSTYAILSIFGAKIQIFEENVLI